MAENIELINFRKRMKFKHGQRTIVWFKCKNCGAIATNFELEECDWDCSCGNGYWEMIE